MHECPNCGQACDCDGEDTWFDDVLECEHDCEPMDDPSSWIDDDRQLTPGEFKELSDGETAG